MRLLLDTHLLLWATASSHRLSAVARDLIEDPENDVHYSAASVWEITIKTALRRRDFRVDLSILLPAFGRMGLAELPVTGAHAVAVAVLPRRHRDPFDRLLVAQSAVESMVLLTNDEALRGYGATVRLV